MKCAWCEILGGTAHIGNKKTAYRVPASFLDKVWQLWSGTFGDKYPHICLPHAAELTMCLGKTKEIRGYVVEYTARGRMNLNKLSDAETHAKITEEIIKILEACEEAGLYEDFDVEDFARACEAYAKNRSRRTGALRVVDIFPNDDEADDDE
jgi:hypothetical protein